jgi:glycosyltransferase involved in cell wall biosynthesis
MKKIVIATDAWYPQVNGVVSTLQKTKEFLEKKDFEVFVIHPGLFMTMPIFFYPEVRLAFFSKNKIKKIIRKENPDYIHIATEGTIGLATRSVCLSEKIKFTTSYHTHFPFYINPWLSFLSAPTFFLLKWFHNSGEDTMVCSESLKKDLEERGFKKLTIWPLGVDEKLFQKSFNKPKEDNFARPVFTYLGRVSREKNIEEFLKLDLFGTKLIIGDGPLKKNLEKKYTKNTVFVGYKKGQKLVDWLSVSNVLVFPSRTDTFGLTIIEAMSCGIPVAAHNVMGPKDIITNGIDGFLGENLKECALRCLTISKENCRKKAALFSWEKSIDAFIKNLAEINK